MSTNGAGHYLIEDMRGHGKRYGVMIGAWLGWFVLNLVLGQSWIIAFFTAAVVAIIARGVSMVIPGPDPTIRWKVWGRPTWLRIAGAVVFALAWFIAINDTASQMKLWSWVLYAGGAVALGVWAAVGAGRLNIGGGRDFSEPAVTTSPEDVAAGRALAAVHPSLLTRAGLSIKSQYSALPRTGDIVATGPDEQGRPAFEVQIIGGEQTVEDYDKRAGNIASAWGVPRVEVREIRPHVARITAIMSEEGITIGAVPWTPADVSLPVAEYVRALPMGVNVETGAPWTLDLKDRSFVVGGLSRWGKSSFSNALLAHLARHPDVRIAYLDLKRGVEAKAWGDAFDYTDHNADGDAGTLRALEFISAAIDDMSARYQRMGEAGVTNAIEEGFLGPDEPLKIIVVDECSELFKSSTPERSKLANRCIEELASLNQQGLGAGYHIILMTQRPKEATLPLAIRDNVSTAVAFRVKQTGMTGVLGNDYFPESDMLDPTKITRKGQAVVKDTGGDDVDDDREVQRIQMVWLDREQKAAVIEQAHTGAWLDAPTAAPDAPTGATAADDVPDEYAPAAGTVDESGHADDETPRQYEGGDEFEPKAGEAEADTEPDDEHEAETVEFPVKPDEPAHDIPDGLQQSTVRRENEQSESRSVWDL